MSITKQELLSKYRSQYPELQNTPDTKLIADIVNQYPEFKNQISDYELESEKNMWDSMPKWIKSGYNKSIQGMAQEMSTGKKRFDLKGYHPGALEDLGSEIASFFAPADLATTIVGGGIGGAVVKKTAGKYIAKKLMQNRVAAPVANKVAREVLRKQARSSVKIAGQTGSSGLGLGTYSGVHSAFGQLTDPEQGYIDPGKTVKDFATGTVLGSAVGFTNSKLTESGANIMKKIAAETGVFGTLNRPLTEGEMPRPMDYIHAGAMVAGLKGTGYAGSKGLNIVNRGLKNTSARLNKKLKADYAKEIIADESKLAGLEKAYKAEIETDLLAKKSTKKYITNSSKLQGYEVTILPKEAQTVKGRVKVVDVNKGETSFPKKWFESNFFPKEEVGLSSKQRKVNKQNNIRKLEKKVFGTSDKTGKARLETISDMTGTKLNTTIKLKDFGARGLRKYHNHLSDLNTIKTKVEDMKKNGIETYQLQNSIFFDTLLPNKIKPMFEWMRAVKNRGTADPARRRMVSIVNDYQRTKAKTSVNALNLMENMGLTLSKPNKEMISKMVKATGLSKKEVVKNYWSLMSDEVEKGNPLYAPQVKVLTDYLWNNAVSSGVPVAGKIQNFLPKYMKRDIQEALFGDFAKLAESLQKGKSKAYTSENMLDDLANSFGMSSKKFKEKMPEEAKVLQKYIESRYNSFSSETKKAIKSIQERDTTLSKAEALSLLGREAYRESGAKSNHLEMSRKDIGFPKEFYERDIKNILSNYIGETSRRASEVKHFGKNREVLEILIKDVEKRGNYVDAGLMKEISALTSGSLHKDKTRNLPEKFKKVLEPIMNIETLTKIGGGYATLLNLSQTAISTMTSLGLSNTARGLNSMRDPKVMRIVNQSEGNIYKYMHELVGYGNQSSITQKWAEKFLNYSQFNRVNDFNNKLAAATARVSVERFHKKYHSTKPGFRKNQHKQGMLKLGLSEKEISSKRLSEETIISTMGKFAQDSQLQKNLLSDPIFLSLPMFRPFVQFKSFAIRQVPFIANTIKRDIEVGNVMPIIRLAGTGVIGGYAAQKARDMMSSWASGEEVMNAPDSLMVKDLNDFADRLGGLGAFGYMTDLWSSVLSEEKDVMRSLRFLAYPPFASDIDKLFTKFIPGVMSDMEKFKVGGLRRLPTRILDLSGASFIKDLGKRFLETEGMKKSRFKYLRSRQIASFSRRLEQTINNSAEEKKGSYESILKDLRKWNSTYPRFTIQVADFNMRKILRKKVRLAKEKI